MAVNAGEINT